VHAIHYIRDLLRYAATNSDYASVALQVVDEARDIFYRGERGRKLARQTFRKSIVSNVPYMKLAQWSFGLASDVAYVLSGTGLDVRARMKAWKNGVYALCIWRMLIKSDICYSRPNAVRTCQQRIWSSSVHTCPLSWGAPGRCGRSTTTVRRCLINSY
jgi:hypothetical protein